jgi:phage/plasmid-associated DNA primase
MRIGTGYKLHYYETLYCKSCPKKEGCQKEPVKDNAKNPYCRDCAKRNSKGSSTFPMPGEIDRTQPVILVEGEMNALSCRAIGIKNLFAAGGTNGLTGPKVKQYLTDVPEIILFFDADSAGRQHGGFEPMPLTGAGNRPKNIPEIIQKAGYAGKIKLAGLPPVSETGYKDQDALIIAGRRDIVLKAVENAKEYVPLPVPEKEHKKTYEVENPGLSMLRLKCILKKIKRETLEQHEVQPFLGACIKAFNNNNYLFLMDTLKKWGATYQEIRTNSGTEASYLLTIADKYLSRFLCKQLKYELISSGDIYKKIIVQNIPVEIDYDELDINDNARKFAHYGGVRSGALTVADIFDGRIIYDAAKNVKCFYFFNGHVWKHEPDITGIIFNTLLRVVYYYLNVEKTSEEDDKAKKRKREQIIDTLNKLEGRRLRIEIQQEFSGLREDGVYHNSDDKSDPLCFDGESIRETLTLEDGVMEFGGKSVVFRQSFPDEFRKEVLPYKTEDVKNSDFPKLFMGFMRGNFKNNETLETLMYYISLIQSRTQYKYGAFWIGGKNTGKSTTIRLLKHIYHHLIGAMETDILVPKGKTFANGNGPTPYIAAMRGLGASIASETEEGAVLNTGLWKKLTGDDMISARGLNESPKEFRNTAQIIISTNELPKFSRHDGAVVTRMVVIPFLVSHERDSAETKKWEDLLEELRPEFPGVIKLLAEYYISLKNERSGVIPISKESQKHKMGYLAEVETDLDKYINACVSFEPGASEVIKKVYESYMDYYDFDENSGKRGESLSQHRFTRLVLKNYKEKVSETIQRIKDEDKTLRCFAGMKLKSAEEIAAGKSNVNDTAAENIFNAGLENKTSQQQEPETEENPFG